MLGHVAGEEIEDGAIHVHCRQRGLYGIHGMFGGERLQRLSENVRSKAGLVPKTISVDGGTIAYLEGGTGETLVLVHGFGGDKDNWTMMAKPLGKRYHLIIPDLPPFGESTKDVQTSYDVESQADRIHAFLKVLNTGPVFLAGHSMGGEVAGVFAAKYPAEVTGLILIDCGGIASPDRNDILSQALQGQDPNPLIVCGVEDFDRLMQANFAEPPYIPSPVKKYLAERAIRNKAFDKQAFADIQAKPSNLQEKLDRLTMPVMIIWGDRDRIIDVSCVRILEKNLPCHRTYILKDCGHSPEIERPQETAGVVRNFIESEFPRR